MTLLILAWAGWVALAHAYLNHALSDALDRTDAAAVDRLVRLGADVTVRGKSGEWQPLHATAWDGDATLVDAELRRGAAVDSRSSDGSTPLMYAAREGRCAVMLRLIVAGADVNAVDHQGRSVLYQAAGEQWGAFDLLVENGADAHATLELLLRGLPEPDFNPWPWLQRGVEPRRTGSWGGYSLAMIGAARNDVRLVELALRRGVDPNLQGRNRTTALMYAAGIPGAPRDPRITEMLVSAGADVNARDVAGRTALQLAVEAGNAGAVAVLLRQGADPRLEPDEPLVFRAAVDRRPDIVRLLLRAGAPDLCDDDRHAIPVLNEPWP